MRMRLLFLAACVFVAAAAAGQARLTIRTPFKDFGTIPQGEELIWAFLVENTGDADLEILKIDSCAECAVVTDFDNRLGPGARGSLTVSVRTAGFLQRFSRSVTLVTNDPAADALASTVTIEAVIERAAPTVRSAPVVAAAGDAVLRLPDLGLHLRFGATDDTPSVERVDAGSTAESAGLRQGDLLAAIAGQPVTSPASAVRLLSEQSGKIANVEVWRAENPVEAALPVRMSTDSWSQARADAEKTVSALTRERIRRVEQAIAAYRVANGSYPDAPTLQRLRDALVPSHADALPMFDGSGDPLFYVLSPDRMEYRVVSGSQTVMAKAEAPRDSDAPDQPQADSRAAPPAAKAASARPGPSPREAKAAGERGRALYFGDKNTVKDEAAAFPWLLRAAEGGDAFAMSIVGGYYWFGRGNVVEDHSEALRWLRSAVAAEPGRAYEWCSIGDILFDGQENVREEREALQAYEQCFARAEDDSRRGFAAYDIGQVYERWNDPDRAVEWFEKSARFKPEWDLPRKKADALRAKR